MTLVVSEGDGAATFGRHRYGAKPIGSAEFIPQTRDGIEVRDESRAPRGERRRSVADGARRGALAAPECFASADQLELRSGQECPRQLPVAIGGRAIPEIFLRRLSFFPVGFASENPEERHADASGRIGLDVQPLK